MTVTELMEILKECDPDAQVYTLQQPNRPFEFLLGGVAIRSHFSGDAAPSDDDDNDDEEDEPPGYGVGSKPEPNDVFLCEGDWARYGTDAAWDNLL